MAFARRNVSSYIITGGPGSPVPDPIWYFQTAEYVTEQISSWNSENSPTWQSFATNATELFTAVYAVPAPYNPNYFPSDPFGVGNTGALIRISANGNPLTNFTEGWITFAGWGGDMGAVYNSRTYWMEIFEYSTEDANLSYLNAPNVWIQTWKDSNKNIGISISGVTTPQQYLNGNLTYVTWSTGPTTGSYRASVLGNDGKIYAAPYTANSGILVINPQNNTSDVLNFNMPDLGAGEKYMTGTLAPNGKIYYPPLDYNQVLIIDPLTQNAILTDFGLTFSGTDQYDNSTLGPDNKIYCVGKSGCLVIDPQTNTANIETFGNVVVSGNAYRWRGMTRSVKNNKLYLAPYVDNAVLIIDTANNSATRSNLGVIWNGLDHQGISNGKDGRLYMPPHNQNYWSIIDPVANTCVRVGQANGKSAGAVMGDDGNVYAMPFDQSVNRFVQFNVSANTSQVTDFGVTLGNELSRWWGATVAPNGKIYSLPDTPPGGNTHILVLDPRGTGSNNNTVFTEIVKTPFVNTGF